MAPPNTTQVSHVVRPRVGIGPIGTHYAMHWAPSTLNNGQTWEWAYYIYVTTVIDAPGNPDRLGYLFDGETWAQIPTPFSAFDPTVTYSPRPVDSKA